MTSGRRAWLAHAAVAVAAIALSWAVTGADNAGRSVRFHVSPEHPEQWFVELTGGRARSPQAHEALAVYALPADGRAAGADAEGLPPLIGRYESAGGALRFIPRFAPVAGVTYVARAAGAAESRFALPAVASTGAARTRVMAIYPTIDRVPANLLKLYVEFSSPMGDGEAERRLHLFDARGYEMPRAFLHVDAELWNETHTRLTVLFDPGRIKRGLRANLEEGAPLSDGQTVRLAIDPAWRDGHGTPLASAFERTLTVGPADRTSPDWRRWMVEAPKASTTVAVTVRFDEPLDRALLDRWLMVVDKTGAPVRGHATIGPDQTSWSFTPDQSWRGDRYRILIDPRLEDLAGNSLSSLFDVDAAASTRRRHDATRTPLVLSFRPRLST